MHAICLLIDWGADTILQLLHSDPPRARTWGGFLKERLPKEHCGSGGEEWRDQREGGDDHISALLLQEYSIPLIFQRIMRFLFSFSVAAHLSGVVILSVDFVVAMPVCFSISATNPLVSWHLPAFSYFRAKSISSIEMLWISFFASFALKVEPLSFGFLEEYRSL